MTTEIKLRIAALRQCMLVRNVHAFIIPSSDPHLSEYPAAHWEARKWISGFTGSAGTLVLTQDKAAMWTDSRYFLQATSQLAGTGIELMKEGLAQTPSIEEWIASQLSHKERVGIDGNVYAAKAARTMAAQLDIAGLQLVTDWDPFAEIWQDRPQIPKNPIFVLPQQFAGESTASKIDRISTEIEKKGAKALLIASLDTIAWLFNIRGNDVQCNPVAVSYALVSKAETVLFIDKNKLSQETTDYLLSENVVLADYTKIQSYIAHISGSICLNSEKIALNLYTSIPSHCRILDMLSPADWMKSIKNEVEIQGFRNAMQRDGVALTRFLMWLEEAIPSGNVSEITIPEKLLAYRSEQQYFVGESFDTIAGYAANGAIVHYNVSPTSSTPIQAKGFLLIDSGGQYFDGTTDITRTIAVGVLTQQMKEDYTLVLKGHIGIATAIYPEGTRGSQLDILARKALWDKGLNYLHGTGHGVGHFLNVHEGPQSIRMNENPTTLEIGMITSNEPGIYRANEYGIRIENLVLTQHALTTEFGNFYAFDTLTLCPIDTSPICKEMLTDTEIDWLNTYHKIVYNRLAPLLLEEEKMWLKEKTNEI